ncbi:MAG: transglycosylase SLT domain-containing protein [bacterium]|nr:transglycosylase SLT domain-containing protein [bacterium]
MVGRASAAPRQATSARSPLLAAVRQRPELGDLALHLRATQAAARDDADTASSFARRLRANHPDSIWLGSTAVTVGRVRRRTGDLPGAAEWFVLARSRLAGSDPRATLATLGLAEIAYARGDDADALDLASQVRTARPKSLAARRARRIAERARQRQPALGLTPQARITEAGLRLDEGDSRAALDAAMAVIATDPPPRLRAEALWVRARAERALGGRNVAEEICRELGAHAPADLGSRALAAAARWRWNDDDDAGAQVLFRELLARFPDGREAPEALYAIGRIDQEAGRFDAAGAAYGEVAERWPASRNADDARWRAGWVQYLAGNPAAAAEHFAALADDSPRATRIAAEYWEARSLEVLGDPRAPARLQHVAEHHPTTYYGALARLRLGMPAPVADPELVVAASRPAFPEDLGGPHADRARALWELGYFRLARLEIDALADAAPAESVLAAYAAVDAPGAALRVARSRVLGSDRQYLYPLGYWDVVREQAAARNLDPLLVTALIRQESLFTPDAVSHADAHGLMQLLPGTAREVAAATGMPPPDRAALHRVGTNVTLGTALLRRLLDRYQGSQVKALAAYNAGVDAVTKWERRYGERPEDEFVELISFRETRDYVKSVLQHYATYRDLYVPAPSPLATSDGSPPNAPFDMMTMTSPGVADPTR